jgi:hypothetical protein
LRRLDSQVLTTIFITKTKRNYGISDDVMTRLRAGQPRIPGSIASRCKGFSSPEQTGLSLRHVRKVLGDFSGDRDTCFGD